MRPTLRYILSACLLVAAACTGMPPASPVGAQPVALEIRSEPLAFKLDEPGLQRIGKLIWRGGVSMTANSANFGGWSDLHVTLGRTHLDLDLGYRQLAHGDDRLRSATAISRASAARGSARCAVSTAGRCCATRNDSDAEGMAASARRHMAGVVRAPASYLALSDAGRHAACRQPPPDFERQPENGGVEAMAGLSDGRVIAISEEYAPNAGCRGWAGSDSRRPAAATAGRTFELRHDSRLQSDRHDALLAGGHSRLLERAFDMARGVRVRVMRIAAADAAGRRDGSARGTGAARVADAVDNLEGVRPSRGRAARRCYG
jgi:hypothetical protein